MHYIYALCYYNITMQMKNKAPKPKRLPIWLPYLQSIKETQKGVFEFTYNGGKETTDLHSAQPIMIYGESDYDIPIAYIDKIVRSGVPIIIHRRNMSQPIYIIGGSRPDPDDTVSHQIKIRSQSRTATHCARQILAAKMKSMSWLTPVENLPQFVSINELRNIEAKHAKRYWKKFFDKLGHPEWTRRGKNPAATALDAHSKFVSGIILRWITYHHLSPYHGFMHTPTDYPSLVYDLMEPYRGIFDQVLLSEWIHKKPEQFLTSGIAITKDFLDDQCYVPLTRQIVTNQELLHGAVLSLKYYCLGRQRKFLIPLPGKPNGGRPPKVDFLLYGRHAGKTDFWKVANKVSGNVKTR
jgi:CRISPR/Cas system-associated endonuclease Cas1